MTGGAEAGTIDVGASGPSGRRLPLDGAPARRITIRPKTNYETWVGPPGHTSHHYLGTVHTDRDGKGTVAGVLPLPEGHYYFLTYVKLDGSVIFDKQHGRTGVRRVLGAANEAAAPRGRLGA